MGVWKTRTEAYHGSKWGYAVVALIIFIVLSLLGTIFYLVGESARSLDIDSESVFTYIVVIVGIIVLLFIIALIFVKVGWLAMASLSGFFSQIHGFFAGIWTVFNNFYSLLLAVILVIVLLIALSMASAADFEINLANPVVIALLAILLFMFFPFAIFIIDMFSLEHE